MIELEPKDADNLSYLPYLLEDDIYLIKEPIQAVMPAVNLEKLAVNAAINPEILPENEVIIPAVVNTLPVAKIVEVAKQVVALPSTEVQELIMQHIEITKQFKKVVILVGYKDEIPKQVITDLIKIFAALNILAFDLEIINVLDANNPNKINEYTYSYLILMGGNGKNLQALQNYQGSRNVFDLAAHQGIKIYFAQAMDTYIKPENIELKKKFWLKLKELFEM